ncbi:MAG: winged helix DNA-binding domain-containing protein [Candidatus Eremiobacteraeota bacterium]|nr:winged helix DNA-binding domain-containing protein [Candidatus Eremiobacteraeota bacterium]
MDSVNVLVRSHYLPAFSRAGPYERAALDALTYGPRRELFEYWAHEASLVPIATYPLLRWRMERASRHVGTWSGMARVAREKPAFVETLRATIAADGPMSASNFEGARGKGSWWGWSEVKHGLEFLFFTGVLAATARRSSFERVYDLAERVIPKATFEAPHVDEADAQRELVAIAARALGVATEADLRDYFRLPVADARARIAELVEAARLLPVAVEGWKGVAYVDPQRRAPRAIRGSALLSPFDSLVWSRPRAARLFDFDYRLEIYTPAHKRVHGYYVLPYLLDDMLVARVDLKADRAASILRAHATTYEAGVDRERVESALREDLRALATWLHLEKVGNFGTRSPRS